MPPRSALLPLAAAGGAVLALCAVAPASAHEHRTVGGGAYIMRVGWTAEPTFTGVRNGVQLFLSDAQSHPVTDLNGSLKVQPVYQGQRGDQLTLAAAFGGSFGTPGEYDAPLTPTRPGDYTFHFTGDIHGTAIDESFTSSTTTFDTVRDTAAIEFPVKDPSNGELSTALQRTGDRLTGEVAAVRSAAQDADDAAKRATIIGVVALVLGVLLGAGGGVALRGARTRS